MVSKILTVTVPNDPVQVIEVQVPGQAGPAGPVGPAGPPDLISIGTITTTPPGGTAAATISGATPNRLLNLTIPQGPKGDTGPPNVLTVGTINTLAEGQTATATITGTAPNQILNLAIPRGYGVRGAGTTGQVLQKRTDADYDTEWITATSLATANTLMKRDANGRIDQLSIAGTGGLYVEAAATINGVASSNTAPTLASHLTRKDYVDGKTWPVATISDSTATGRALVTATDAAAARTAIGTTATGSALITALDAAAARTAIGATATGSSLITAADAAAARTAIGAGTSSLALGTTSTTAKAGDYTPPDATTGAKGLVQLANHLGGTATAPTVRSASETQTGIVELATAAETTAGTDNTRAVHPQGLKVELDKKATVAGGVLKVEQITQAAYDALGTKVATTLYVIVG